MTCSLLKLAQLDSAGRKPAILGIDLEDGTKEWAVPFEDLEGVDLSVRDVGPDSDAFPYVVSEETIYILTNDKLLAVRSAEAVDAEEGRSEDDTGTEE